MGIQLFIKYDFTCRGTKVIIDNKGFTHTLSKNTVTVLKDDIEITTYYL